MAGIFARETLAKSVITARILGSGKHEFAVYEVTRTSLAQVAAMLASETKGASVWVNNIEYDVAAGDYFRVVDSGNPTEDGDYRVRQHPFAEEPWVLEQMPIPLYLAEAGLRVVNIGTEDRCVYVADTDEATLRWVVEKGIDLIEDGTDELFTLEENEYFQLKSGPVFMVVTSEKTASGKSLREAKAIPVELLHESMLST